MYYQLSRITLTEIQQNGFKSQFSGSSCKRAWNNNIFEKPQKPQKPATPILDDNGNKYEIIKREPRNYGLKKNKIRNKILNFFALNRSQKFCAFYTITFPMTTDDTTAYKVLNTWLTRCRKELNLKSYLWVAERQKNNTLHFHLLTNNYMEIRKANEFMKACLLTQFKKSNLNTTKEIIEKYNGIDVDNVHNSKRNNKNSNRLNKTESKLKLAKYLTKYITKNDTKSLRLPWHCSRDISALFISINYTDISDHEISTLIADNPEAVITYKEEYFTVHFLKFTPNEKYFSEMVKANNKIFDSFHT